FEKPSSLVKITPVASAPVTKFRRVSIAALRQIKFLQILGFGLSGAGFSLRGLVLARANFRRLKSLCENCKIGTSAAKAALILQTLCRG
ncbi:MAG TPA: hypothetical protein VG272_09650, partial [Candidatus Acidoferrales bacterium]|nr:hypothetical protein [Candidatus Acidoferrales bacterium]